MIVERVILANSDDDDDLYSGYNEVHPALDSKALHVDEGFQQAILKSSYGKRNTGTGFHTTRHSRMGTAGYKRGTTMMSSSKRRGSNDIRSTATPTARPMTSVKGVGYSSQGNRNQTMFDPLNQAKSIASPLQRRDETSPEAKMIQLEKKINDLYEESCLAAHRNEFTLALDKAKEAQTKERTLFRLKEQSSVDTNFNGNYTDLTFAILFNLAIQYTNKEMYSEAINVYQSIIKNRTYTNTGRIKLNIGNIYFKQSNYPKAIKFYRMALDQIQNQHKELRLKIMHNIGISFVRLNQYADAITSFEYILSEKNDYQAAFHLIVCHYALGDKEKMKKCFIKLLDVRYEDLFEEKYLHHADEDDPMVNLLIEAVKNDKLRKIEKNQLNELQWAILTGAKLIAPIIGDNFSRGYEWCVEQIRNSPSYSSLANDLEINKAVKHLKKREFNEAITTLKSFEKRDNKSASTAATDLSFLYYLQNELSLAEKYADNGIEADRYNSGALVNKGNCCFKHGDYEKAKEYYREAVVNDSGHVEAIYNLALTNKKLGNYEVAVDYLYKLQNIVKNHPHILFQLANIFEHLNDKDQAVELYQQFCTYIPSDPSILIKISDILEHDKLQSLSYLNDSYRYYPSHIPTIERLAAYYIESKIYEKAIKYLDRASQVEPNQIKWQLMIAACYRRSGNYQQALQCYKLIHKKFPENIECLKFLIRVCTDLGLADVNDYVDKLKKLEKSKEIKEQRAQSSLSIKSNRSSLRRSNGNSREGSASSNSSGYLTSASPRSTGSRIDKHKLNGTIDNNIIDLSVYDDLAVNGNERPTTSWKIRKDEDDFVNDDIDEILPG